MLFLMSCEPNQSVPPKVTSHTYRLMQYSLVPSSYIWRYDRQYL